MNDTVAYTRVADWWNGKVLIDEIKMFTDTRGMVSEIWRIDSELGLNSKQCYISETAPYVQRGPHEHEGQCDNFISWKNNMVYQMYNPFTNEMKTFITEKDKIYRVFVDIGIIHSYRNLDKEKSFTLNFPTALFKGEGKKHDIDEIRHEENYEKNDVIVVFGAGGKLGKEITNTFFSKMGKHNYDVIPSYEKLKSKEEVLEFFKKLDLVISPERKVYFINCAALTNVQDANTLQAIWEWSNSYLPVEFTIECDKRKWNFIQFSTDYVFQKVEKGIVNYNLSAYTKSKIHMENILLNNLFKAIIIRVANLYSEDDIHNVIFKMKQALKVNNEIKVDPRLKIYPSNVKDVAACIHQLYTSYVFGSCSKQATINLIPNKSFYLPEFVKEFFGVEPLLENGKIEPWHSSFEKGEIIPFNSNLEPIRTIVAS
jgi:dTDP-4-dehydrorhamnose reductase/dTDP-4-dehydrorhamnose 3,5-epimerase-like enzyme